MSNSTRRTFLAATGAGAAVAATATMASGAVIASTSSTVTSGAEAGSADGSVVAYVSDGATGELALMVGEREVVVRDPDLVARLRAHLH